MEILRDLGIGLIVLLALISIVALLWPRSGRVFRYGELTISASKGELTATVRRRQAEVAVAFLNCIASSRNQALSYRQAKNTHAGILRQRCEDCEIAGATEFAQAVAQDVEAALKWVINDSLLSDIRLLFDDIVDRLTQDQSRDVFARAESRLKETVPRTVI